MPDEVRADVAEPGRDREREVPWRDDRADATRLVAVDVRLAGALADRYARTEPQRLAPVVLAVVDRLADVGVGLGKRLARLEHLERREGGPAATKDGGRAKERRGAIAARRGAPAGERP